MKWKVPWVTYKRYTHQAIFGDLKCCGHIKDGDIPELHENTIVYAPRTFRKIVWKECGILDWIYWQYRKLWQCRPYMGEDY
jgi:hypothetical protein